MEHEIYILEAVRALGSLTYDQINRFLFEGGILPQADLLPALAALKKDRRINQVLSPLGIVLAITDEGRAFAAANESAIPAATRQLIADKAAEYQKTFQREQNYLAQYSEESSGTVPISLSVRSGTKIAIRVNLVTHDTATAKTICENWMKNSSRAYSAFWQAIAEGAPEPTFWQDRPEEA